MLAVAVLAAGKGTRMKSALPKVLQPLAGATLVERVLASAANLQPERRLLIVGHQAERVEQQLAPLGGLEFVLQQPQNGTGHAVQQLIPSLQGFEGELLVLNGDVPLLRSETVEALVQQHRASGADVTLLTARLENPTGYGRVFADAEGQVAASLSIAIARTSNAATTSPTLGSIASTGRPWPTFCPSSAPTTIRGSFTSPTRWRCCRRPCTWRWPMPMK